MFKKKLVYLTDSIIPNTNAESIHILKICDSFSKMGYETTIFSPYVFLNSNEIKKNYNLSKALNFNKSFNKKIKLNFFFRLIHAYKAYKLVRNNKFQIILSRSIISSIFLNFFNIKNILEIHHEISGLTKIIFNYLKKKKRINHIKLVLLHANLVNKIKPHRYNIIYRILDDGVNPEEFQIKSANIFEKTCAYTGSFYTGKGVEIIEKLAVEAPSIQFHLYGDKKFLEKKFYPKNMVFFDYIKYKEIPQILSSYEILLMPYQRNVKVRSKISNISNYMSPLKLFEYLASGKILMATNLEVYSHILKDGYNSFLFNENDIQAWVKKIHEIFANLNKFEQIRENSIITAKKYSWSSRAKKIEELLSSNFL